MERMTDATCKVVCTMIGARPVSYTHLAQGLSSPDLKVQAVQCLHHSVVRAEFHHQVLDLCGQVLPLGLLVFDFYIFAHLATPLTQSRIKCITKSVTQKVE